MNEKEKPTPPEVDEFAEFDENDTTSPREALAYASREELEAKLNESDNKLNAALATIEEGKNQLLRAQAETHNVLKRCEKDVVNAHKYGVERFVNELLPIVDSLERGLTIDVGDNEFALKVHAGLEMTHSLFLNTLEKFMVKPINPSNEPFNPELHQAISVEENPELPSNTVIKVLQKGYLLNDRLIRPALVIVTK